MKRKQTEAVPDVRGWARLEPGAKYLGVNLSTLKKLIAEGKVPAYRIAHRTVLVKYADLDAYIERAAAEFVPSPNMVFEPALEGQRRARAKAKAEANLVTDDAEVE
jgi:excisionase family DNA binding protein